ncbi:MAG TPA: hypothetical protein VIF12_06070, partial [Micavibrio sp.]
MSATAIENSSSSRSLRTPLGDVMNFEILINEKSQVWIFHDKAMPSRLAWIEFDPAAGMLELISHDMRNGLFYADVPAALSTRICKANLVYLYLTDGEKVTGFQKIPMQVRK